MKNKTNGNGNKRCRGCNATVHESKDYCSSCLKQQEEDRKKAK